MAPVFISREWQSTKEQKDILIRGKTPDKDTYNLEVGE